jgi:putative DNA primase/helicase
MPTGAALSDFIKQASTRHHGYAGRAFLQKLTYDKRDFCAMLEGIKALPRFSSDLKEGQHKRAAHRFALVALAGELATEYGLTGWSKDMAINVAGELFEQWKLEHGFGDDEQRKILDQISDFIDKNGDSRFSEMDNEIQVCHNRAGYFEDSNAGRIFFFNKFRGSLHP